MQNWKPLKDTTKENIGSNQSEPPKKPTLSDYGLKQETTGI